MTNNIVEAFNKTRKAGAIASATLDEVVKCEKIHIEHMHICVKTAFMLHTHSNIFRKYVIIFYNMS